ncbi:hypothetical protein RSOLAG1IB_03117 [Rhizoctonia solani AG-1 IB]|uniref:Uncharacterized protein n=1 Tax=Thanatephorus cucumeris (strain AG1-IB / isolate 7/3/14) TaxID=1108050 RepID=A0A0B7FK45_THACB|nr:hypothetical protein RSOLAG1IB_03117 [Rhizoctonia solani AG-1 IB]
MSLISTDIPGGRPLTQSTSAASSVGGVLSSSSTFSVSTSAFSSSGTLSLVAPTNSTIPTTRVTTATQSHSGPTTATSRIISSLSRTSTRQVSPPRTSVTPSSSTNVTATTPSFGPSRSTLTSLPAPLFASPTTSLPTTQQSLASTETNSTSSVTTSSYQVSPTTQSSNTKSTSPTATTEPEPEPALTPAPSTPERITHRLNIDLGECSGFASPRFSLNQGELGELVSFGDGVFQVELKSDLDYGSLALILSLKDGDVRCGSSDMNPCVGIMLSFGPPGDVFVSVIRGGESGLEMYPFSIWLEDGVTWDAHLANSPDEMYHCWGWDPLECPFAFQGNGVEEAAWAVSSDNPTGDIFISFCPSGDAPPWYNIPTNPNPNQGTYVVLPTQTAVPVSTFIKPVVQPTKLSTPVTTGSFECEIITTCVRPNTYVVWEETTTSWSTFLNPEFLSTYPPTTVITYDTTATSQTTFITAPKPATAPPTINTSIKPLPIKTPWTSSALTGTVGRPTVTSTRSGTPISVPTVIPTYSYITDSIGSVVSTVAYDITASAATTTTSVPNTEYTLTSWSTWMTINGSSVPAIAGEVGTYVVLPTQTAALVSTFIKPVIQPTKLSTPVTTGSFECEIITTCVQPNTYVVWEETTTSWSTFLAPEFLSTYPPATAIAYDTTATSQTTFITAPAPATTPSTINTSIKPLPIQTPWTPSTLTETVSRPTVTSTGSETPISAPTVIPTYSYITDSIGSIVSTVAYDITLSAAPTTTSVPNTQYILTSWSTWMTVNGSSVPAIAGEVGVLSTASTTYLLESGTVIPLSELSTRTTASRQTPPPSSTVAASVNDNPTSQGRGGKIAGAVVGALVGLVLGGILLWRLILAGT